MNILVTGYFGAENYGDDILFASFCRIFFENNPGDSLWLLQQYERPLGFTDKRLKVIPLYKIKKGKTLIVKTIMRFCDMFMWIGGTCFTDREGDGCSVYMIPAMKLGLMTGYVGIGIANLTDEARIQTTKYLLSHCDFATFRDVKSYEKAIQFRGNDHNFYFTEDLAYLFLEQKDCFEESVQENNALKKVVISWRDLKGYMEPSSEDTIINELCSFAVDYYKKNQCEIYIVPLDNRRDNEKNELIFKKMVESGVSKCYLMKNLSFKEKHYHITHCDLNVCARLHGIFYSELNNIPTIAISYSIKTDSFLKSIDRYGDCISVENITAQKLHEYAKRAEEEKKSVDLQMIDDRVKASRRNGELLKIFLRENRK